ncbi:hypothetical protein C4D60_Mb02t13590 [Musa balbisiana]|uniref:Auxin-responsive protein n=1 Tax=Musa balbisiana TaxID=52838 RepID=A0A4S8IAJ1_MUSBA|nr:hypothetical protein C4D60_Mb02t13590 [Musa balbisiana]
MVVTPVRHPGDQRPPCTKAFAQRAFPCVHCCFHVSLYISLPSWEGFLPPPQARSAGIPSIWHTMEAAASYVKDGGDLRDTELRLGLPGTEAPEKPAAPSTRVSKRALQEDGDMESRAKSRPLEADSDEAPAAKTQIVGWPPIRSYRRNSFPPRKVEAEAEAEAAGLYVKVSMDGAPYLRKIDLKVYKGYKELRDAMDNMFKCFTQGEVSRKEGCSSGSESAITYEDKDGDLMLVGDVPWEMFISSCRRLRIMKGCEVRGLRTRQYS